jgi:hypothetical protein
MTSPRGWRASAPRTEEPQREGAGRVPLNFGAAVAETLLIGAGVERKAKYWIASRRMGSGAFIGHAVGHTATTMSQKNVEPVPRALGSLRHER